MSMSDDPRGYRRDQTGGRDYAASRQGHGGRASPPDDRYDGYRQAEPPASRPPQHSDKPQPSFSAYRPEAYANPVTGEPSRPPNRNAPPPRDPYYQNGGGDPYATPSQRGGYEPDWDRDPYPDAGQRIPNFYPPADDLNPDVQSVHDRFFSSDPQADNMPPPPPLSGRLRNAFDDHDFDDRAPQSFDRGPAPRRPEPGPYDGGFEDEQFYDWDKHDQAPAPSAARPVHPPALRDEDLDADFFSDEDDYDPDDYEFERGGGRKKLIAAVLVGAVVVGGGLAYGYKSANEGGEGDPSVVAADSRPVKEEPSDPGGREFPNGNKLIYERLPGYETASASVVTSQSPQESDGASSSSGSSDNIPGIVTTGGTLEERIENALKAQGGDKSEGASDQASPDAPRAIRTITYGPDGNPVEAENRTKRVAAADTDGNSVSTGDVISSTPSGSDNLTAGQADAPAQQPEPVVESAPEPAQVANVAPEQQAPQIADATGGTGAYFVQIGARNDRDAAVAAFATLQKKYASVIGNYSPAVRKADLGDKGVWYRLWVGPVENEGNAKTLCEQLKGAGMPACLVRKDQ